MLAAFLAGLAGWSFVADAAPQAVLANQFVYRAGYQRFNRYQYRNHAWFRTGFFFAAAPGFYPSIGYLGFVPPPVYALPPYPPYAYPAPYYRPPVPYTYGAPAVPYYYGFTGPAPFAVPFAYGRFVRPSFRYRGYGSRAWYVRHGGWSPQRYGYRIGFHR